MRQNFLRFRQRNKNTRGIIVADIFLTNDDGVYSPGFLALEKELNSLGSLLLVAPNKEKSWISKGISRFKRVKLRKVKLADGRDAFSIEGTPVDATLVGLFILSENLPKLVISGINSGANAGNAFVFSSGTIGAAIEAAMIGLPALAVSLIPARLGEHIYTEADFKWAAKLTRMMAQRILKYGLPENVNVINLNIPSEADGNTEIVVTEIAKLHYGCLFEKSLRKNEFAFLKDISSAKGAKYDLQPGTDAYTVFIERKISVTPINIDMTGDLLEFRKWMELEI